MVPFRADVRHPTQSHIGIRLTDKRRRPIKHSPIERTPTLHHVDLSLSVFRFPAPDPMRPRQFFS
jgi:hypothetical protein